MSAARTLVLAIVVAVNSLAMALAASAKPSQVHIALAGRDAGGNSNGMAVSWQTGTSAPGSQVQYGTSEGALTAKALSVESSYYATFDQHAVLANLTSDTVYFYRVGGPDAWSDVFSFRAAPLSQSTSFTKFAVWGDMGVVHGQATRKYLAGLKSKVDLMWHAGDISYADDAFLHGLCAVEFCYEKTWNTYMEEMEDTASVLPYMVAPGNHEAECHSPNCLLSAEKSNKLRNFSAYNARFRMPYTESGGTGVPHNMWSSFNYGPVHFVSIDTETGYPGAPEERHGPILRSGGFGGKMLEWLEMDLKRAVLERKVRPWIVATGHHPMYQGGGVNHAMQKALEELFYTYHVDVFFTGHIHSYERDYPVYRGVPQPSYDNPRATVHIMVGGGGNDEMSGDHVDGPSVDETGMWVPLAQKVEAAVDKGHFGIGVVEASLTMMNFSYVRTASGQVFDGVVITKDQS